MLVPFSGRRLTGVVVEAGREGALRLSQVERLIDETPALSPELLDALREEADRTLCPVGLALGTALPAGSAPRMIRELPDAGPFGSILGDLG